MGSGAGGIIANLLSGLRGPSIAVHWVPYRCAAIQVNQRGRSLLFLRGSSFPRCAGLFLHDLDRPSWMTHFAVPAAGPTDWPREHAAPVGGHLRTPSRVAAPGSWRRQQARSRTSGPACRPNGTGSRRPRLDPGAAPGRARSIRPARSRRNGSRVPGSPRPLRTS